jgi:hypothetical protein
MSYESVGGPGVNDPVPSFFHVIVVLLCLILLNIGIVWILSNPLIHLLEWFNHLSLFWKWLLLFPGGFMLFEIERRLASMVAAFLGMLIYFIFPLIRFTTKATVIRRITSKDNLC